MRTLVDTKGLFFCFACIYTLRSFHVELLAFTVADYVLNSWRRKALWTWTCSFICNLCRDRSLLLRPQYARDVACPLKVLQGFVAPSHYSVWPSQKMSRVPFLYLYIYNSGCWMKQSKGGAGQSWQLFCSASIQFWLSLVFTAVLLVSYKSSR